MPGTGGSVVEDLGQILVHVVRAAISDLMEVEPAGLVHVAPVLQRGRIRVGAGQSAEGRTTDISR